MTNEEKIKIALKHISYSRLIKWKAGKRGFENWYFYGRRPPQTKAMAYGNKVDDQRMGIVPKKEMTSKEISVLKFLPKELDCLMENELEGKIKHKGVVYKLVGRPDYILRDGRIGEEKATNIPSLITKARGQIEFYDMIRKNMGLKPFFKGVIYQKRKGADGKLNGIVEIYDHEWSKRQIEKWETRVRHMINEVHLAYPIETSH